VRIYEREHFFLMVLGGSVMALATMYGLGLLIEGYVSSSIESFIVAIGGAYLAYYAYKKQMMNLVAKLGMFRDVYYDEK
jgi:threonine/homoserine/homoserine lactone efflux protein